MSGGSVERGRKPTVVVVDDSDEVRNLVRTRLRLSGLFDVVGDGRDGADAIGLAFRHEPDLILLDISMPVMDGLEALPAILTLAPESKVVMFTGFEEEGLAARAQELGAVAFVEKSIRIEELPDRLWQVVAGGQKAPERPRLRAVGADATPPDAPEQAVLDEHLERFRELFDQAAIGMATMTLNGSIVRANGALAAFMGCEPADLIGVDYGELTRGKGDALDHGLALITTQGEDLTLFEHQLPGDESRIVQVTLTPIRDSQGAALYVFAQVQDISAQRQAEDALRRSEERFRLLVTAVEEYAIYMLDPTGHVISWNAGAQRIKGYSVSEILGQHFRVFYPPEEQASGHPEHNLELALAHGQYAEEGWRIRKDGTRFWASVVLTAIYDEAGRHFGFAKVTRDQSEARERAEERRRAEEQQAHLLAVTAHELRTPAAVIDGSAQTLMAHGDQLTPAERAQFLSGIRGSAHRLNRLVSDLTTASRLQSDTLRIRAEEVTLSSLLESAVARARVAHPGLEVGLEIHSDATLSVDPSRMGQLLDNLLDNANLHGWPPIVLTGEVTDDGAQICVSDAGPGVPEELLDRLFDRFAYAGPSGATGLGLYLVREIARGHGGDVAYMPSAPGRHSAFVVTLPLDDDAARGDGSDDGDGDSRGAAWA